MFKLFISVSILLCSLLHSQTSASITNLNGGCQPVKDSFFNVTRPVIGSQFIIDYSFPEPAYPQAWLMIGFSDPNIPVWNSCTLHSSYEIFIQLGSSSSMSGSFILNIPPDPIFIGGRFYAQGAWWAQSITISLTDGFLAVMGV